MKTVAVFIGGPLNGQTQHIERAFPRLYAPEPIESAAHAFTDGELHPTTRWRTVTYEAVRRVLDPVYGTRVHYRVVQS